MLVDGERLAGMIDDAAQLGVMKLKRPTTQPVQPFARDAERTNGVKHTDKAYAHIGITDLAQAGVIGRKSLLRRAAVVVPGKRQIVLIAPLRAQQAAGGNKAAQRAHRKGAPRIAEKVDVVSGLVVEGHEAIG